MQMIVEASKHVGRGFPTDEGKRLADRLLEDGTTDWSTLEVDLTSLPAGLLISAFFNAFLQEIADRKKQLLDGARRTTWRVQYDFQRENIARWMRDFKEHA